MVLGCPRSVIYPTWNSHIATSTLTWKERLSSDWFSVSFSPHDTNCQLCLAGSALKIPGEQGAIEEAQIRVLCRLLTVLSKLRSTALNEKTIQPKLLKVRSHQQTWVLTVAKAAGSIAVSLRELIDLGSC